MQSTVMTCGLIMAAALPERDRDGDAVLLAQGLVIIDDSRPCSRWPCVMQFSMHATRLVSLSSPSHWCYDR